VSTTHQQYVTTIEPPPPDSYTQDVFGWHGVIACGLFFITLVVALATWRWAWFHKPPSTGIREFQEQQRDPSDDWKN
jgi:hypothetical protein